jgi:hypothetical protein
MMMSSSEETIYALAEVTVELLLQLSIQEQVKKEEREEVRQERVKFEHLHFHS